MILGLEKRSGVNISKGKSIVKIIWWFQAFMTQNTGFYLEFPGEVTFTGWILMRANPDIKRGVLGTWGPCMYVLLDRLRGAVNWDKIIEEDLGSAKDERRLPTCFWLENCQVCSETNWNTWILSQKHQKTFTGGRTSYILACLCD